MDAVLCDELLEEILRRLPPRSAFSPSTSAVSLVSKRWLRLYRYTRSSLSLLLPLCTPPSLYSFLSHFPHLSFLSLTLPHDNNIISHFPDHLLLSVASFFPKLRLLCLQPNPLSLSSLPSLSFSFPYLTSLYIALSRPFSLRWLLLFHSLKNLGLHFTEIRNPSSIRDEIIDGAELKLETLVLSGTRRGDLGLDWLWRSCKRLRKLQLRRCEGIGNDDAASVSSFNHCLKSLQEVELRICGSIFDEVLSMLAESCASLSSLLVHDGGSRQGLLNFITHSCCSLQKLDLQGFVENYHLLAVAQNFRGLSSLRLQTCYFVTGEGLKTMGLTMSSELEELALISCEMVEREQGLLTALGQTFRSLKKLDLSYNVNLVEKELVSMLASCNCLRELKVRGCIGLTNALLVSMLKSCKQLESVDIMGCPGIGAEAVELFVLNCLQLRQLHVAETKLSDVSRSWASKKFIEVIV